LPAAHADHGVADLEARIVRRFDLADRPPAHHRPHGLRRGIGFGVAEAAAHIGVEREEAMADERFARPGLGNRRFDNAEIRRRDFSGRAMVEQDLLVGRHRTNPR
jgi:hypothetical protein